MRKNKFLLPILLLLINNIVFSQETTQDLNKKIIELKKIVQQKDNEIKGLVKENSYYKESLKLINSKPVNKKNGLEFKVTSAKGDLNSGKIFISILVENKGLPVKFQPNKSDITDPKGNNYTSFKNRLGRFSYIEKLQKNIPTKMTIEYDKIREEIPMIKSLNLFVYNPDKLGRTFNLTFSNIPVTWESTENKSNKSGKTKIW